jgi:hypothetical protein
MTRNVLYGIGLGLLVLLWLIFVYSVFSAICVFLWLP